MSVAKRVLIVEDHHDSRRMMAKILRQKHFDVVEYDCSESAEAHLDACDIDIALLDVRLPGRCGDVFGKQLRASCADTMIVFVTGEAVLEPLKEAVPDCFIMRKPIDLPALMELLEGFKSGSGYSSALTKKLGDKARPGNM